MATKSFPLFIVDAFSKFAFAGNGAAVVVLPYNEIISDEQLQLIAAEMNLSETAFVMPVDERAMKDGNKFKLRWFTPKCEVSLCGHATIAISAVIMNIYDNRSSLLEFETLSGKVFASKSNDQKITIDFPSLEPKSIDASEFSQLIEAAVGALPIQEVLLSPSRKLLIRLKDTLTREELEELKPENNKLLLTAVGKNISGVIISLKGSNDSNHFGKGIKNYDFLSRYFAPWLGITEDPVTGSAHAILAPYWGKALNKKKLFARQCSQRGGELHLEIRENRILISGDAVIVVEGKISF